MFMAIFQNLCWTDNKFRSSLYTRYQLNISGTFGFFICKKRQSPIGKSKVFTVIVYKTKKRLVKSGKGTSPSYPFSQNILHPFTIPLNPLIHNILKGEGYPSPFTITPSPDLQFKKLEESPSPPLHLALQTGF